MRADSIKLTAKSSIVGPCKVLFDIILKIPLSNWVPWSSVMC